MHHFMNYVTKYIVLLPPHQYCGLFCLDPWHEILINVGVNIYACHFVHVIMKTDKIAFCYWLLLTSPSLRLSRFSHRGVFIRPASFLFVSPAHFALPTCVWHLAVPSWPMFSVILKSCLIYEQISYLVCMCCVLPGRTVDGIEQAAVSAFRGQLGQGVQRQERHAYSI